MLLTILFVRLLAHTHTRTTHILGSMPAHTIFPPMCDMHTHLRILDDIIQACENNDVPRLEKILQHAKTLSRNEHEFMAHWINCYDRRGFNPLMTSVYNGANDAVQLLLVDMPQPAKVITGHMHGTTAAHVAAYTSNLLALQLMSQHAHPYDWGNAVRSQDKWGKLPLHHAYFHEFDEGVAFLGPLSPPGVRDSGGRLPEEQEPRRALREHEAEGGLGEEAPGGDAGEAPPE